MASIEETLDFRISKMAVVAMKMAKMWKKSKSPKFNENLQKDLASKAMHICAFTV